MEFGSDVVFVETEVEEEIFEASEVSTGVRTVARNDSVDDGQTCLLGIIAHYARLTSNPTISFLVSCHTYCHARASPDPSPPYAVG